ncbi:acetoacetyl-CoA synthetase [Caerostris extrusa]|uniref:Acetoacetyl-CoA synthetase n=1 Tax=Caerostris extrusa TaxID=172846 RepID=A0AAV4Y9D5_CAEEX|nr:acetoacetyl-CoA synthetase [Caerostris extrusa]
MNSILRKETLFANCYGCTEFLGVSLVNDISLPAHKTEFNGVTLGKPIIGKFGEIILSKPIPGMTLRLWNDDDGSIYRKKYFSYFPGRFAMNDYGVINPYNKNWVVLCRSDETLKLSSARFGSSEIYDVVELFPEVQDSLCVSQHNKELDERAVLFLKMKEGHTFTEELADRIRSKIADELTAFYVPAVVVDIPEIPNRICNSTFYPVRYEYVYNMSGKKMEIVVKKIINNMPYTQETVVNPECLEFYKEMAEQQDFKL